MSVLVHLTNRNNKIFRRDRTLVLLSLLSVGIVILLYAVFLQKTQIDHVEQIVGSSQAVKSMVNEWMVAGLLTITAVTSTLGAFGIMVRDKESKKMSDFLIAPISRVKIQLSYVVNAFIIGLFNSLVALIGCELFLLLTGSAMLSLVNLMKVLGIIILLVALASAINLLLVLFIHSQNAFSTLSTIVGTSIGFLCGVYVPIGSLPNAVQHLIMYFPVSHISVLFRQVLMEDSIQKVFQHARPEQVLEYKLHLGVVYKMNNQLINYSTSIWIIIISMILFIAVSMVTFNKQNK
ncbi:ABC transporter permease [Bacillus solimangrovi]|uniref:Transporter n=1 Tax=Bacillus solimangrovi TaxID=1305675 RepID=A0A1E5LID1_9BACI|nr:ABC transporter permease [Bacillus solimangrovi]OEH93842.1 transporter [Bacillus solimangrovi]